MQQTLAALVSRKEEFLRQHGHLQEQERNQLWEQYALHFTNQITEALGINVPPTSSPLIPGPYEIGRSASFGNPSRRHNLVGIFIPDQ